MLEDGKKRPYFGQVPAEQAVAVRAGKLIPTVLWAPAPEVTLTVGLMVIPAAVEVPEELVEMLVKFTARISAVPEAAGVREASVKLAWSPVVAVEVAETVPILVRLPLPSILTVPEPAPVATEVTALKVPGAMRVVGRDNVTEPVEAEAVIWLAVPAREVTPLLATVMVPVPELVVVIPVPAAMVKVPPAEMVESEPEVAWAVKRAPLAVPQALPVPEIFPELSVCRHWVPEPARESTCNMAFPAPELVMAKVVLEVSLRSMVYVPEAILCRVVSVGSMVRILFPELRVSVLVVEAMVKAPESVMV